MVLAIAYPSTAAGDPHRLSARALAGIASDIRGRLFGVQPRPVDVSALVAKTATCRQRQADQPVLGP